MAMRGSNGAPGKIRTPDPQIRSLVLYPAELPAHFPAASAVGQTGEVTLPGDRSGLRCEDP